MKRAILTTSLSLLLVVSLGYSYVSWVLTARDLPRIATARSVEARESQRWVFVGDVHGMYDEFEQLLRQVGAAGFEVDATLNVASPPPQVVLLGDFISKGPHSAKVLEYLFAHLDSTHCVLGNHEVNVLFAWLNAHESRPGRRHYNPVAFSTEDYVPPVEDVNAHHHRLARQLGHRALSQLAAHCSASLRVQLAPGDDAPEGKAPRDSALYGVHAGLLPEHLDLESAPLKELTNMKYVDKRDHSHTSKTPIKHGVPWYKLWDALPASAPTVLYGHDAKTGHNIRRHTKGLDTGCFAGDRLTALEYYFHKGRWRTREHHVLCRAP
ncbi:LAFE_0H02674g1_1 [Lachancea fermentati]|uniref:LAFE_0H02674g1_1 n=1 Tax=Lachancea fermentati TaxID=4955 RepID=A0A1G4MJB1_LACFM|nr:LAFE_0H02674g1_1 [Lachancea fermentati]